MAQFKALSQKVEVNGETVLSVVAGMGAYKSSALKILKENGIDNPAKGQWYLQQNWLDAFKTISETIGENTLYSIGKKIPESAQWPPQVNSIESGLGSIDVAYHMNHRNGEIGHYNFEKTGDRSAKVVCDNPYPCSFDKGLIEAVAEKFAKQGEHVRIDHDESKGCRNKGGNVCTYLISW